MEMEGIITSYIAQGFVIANRSPVSVTLMKRKEFSVLWTVIGFLLCILPLLIYLIVYASQSDQMIVINLVNGQQPMGQTGVPQLLAPATAPRSPDGNYWWDGQAWQPVQSLPYGGTQPSTPYQPSSVPYSQPVQPNTGQPQQYGDGSPYQQDQQPSGQFGSSQTGAPATAPRSPDGNYWWDGKAWQPVQPNTGQPPLDGDGSPYQQ